MCIFCDIVEGKIPSYCLYEDETAIAFLDISQVTKGHALVVPKQHFDDFLMCEEDVMVHVMRVAQALAKQLMEKTGAKGMHLLSNVHEVAGQSVPHFHVHLIPRYAMDDACEITFHESAEQDLAQLQEQLRCSEIIE